MARRIFSLKIAKARDANEVREQALGCLLQTAPDGGNSKVQSPGGWEEYVLPDQGQSEMAMQLHVGARG